MAARDFGEVAERLRRSTVQVSMPGSRPVVERHKQEMTGKLAGSRWSWSPIIAASKSPTFS